MLTWLLGLFVLATALLWLTGVVSGLAFAGSAILLIAWSGRIYWAVIFAAIVNQMTRR